jgi:hypothetical protein
MCGQKVISKVRALSGLIAASTGLASGLASPLARADEGGASFWLPGQMGSFSAAPAEPGFSLPIVYCHASADAGADKTFSRGGRITAGLKADTDLVFMFPTFVFGPPSRWAWGSAAGT